MPGGSLNTNLADKTTTLANIVTNESFSKLDTEVQVKVIENVRENERIANGLLSSIFGTNKDLVPIYVTFCIIIMLIIGCFISHFCFQYTELWDVILPIITLTIGYYFGKHENT